MKDFRKLEVWQKSYQITLDVYQATKSFPKEEMFGLTSQMRRAAVSIPSNIAEGCGRDGDAELARFSVISMGSASELEYHFLLAHDLNFFDDVTYNSLNNDLNEVRRMLNVFIQRLKKANR